MTTAAAAWRVALWRMGLCAAACTGSQDYARLGGQSRRAGALYSG